MREKGFREEHENVSLSNATDEERIVVSIRVRPLNEREKARHDVSEWECISNNTIRFKNSGGVVEQRSLSNDAYTFDKVFGERSTTNQVYEQGIKEVALSVVSGINCSIFAYGQTSSGKTYTMTGITEYAVRDIYDYIGKHKEREFAVKFSAMEIYNEAVRDLLSANATPLRVLDDPEKGTVVEKLTEETLKDKNQLQQLLFICAAERTTEETAMNETSSRSHQILRLTVESNPNDYARTARSGTLIASVNFVDLAGSERASQALSAGTRLREGSHINRSLLTLGTVIRKLSKERNGHIPYRDSKLTRILHNSLGGNARTAIICTISPARSQVEQSRNTLFFAGCAKQVATNAKVNVMMSDKVLVKQLKSELARMENELRNSTPNTAILRERELQIEKMGKQIKELTRQRNLFQSHVENLLQTVGKDWPMRVDKDSGSELSFVSNSLSPGTENTSENLDKTTTTLSISNEQLSQQSESFEGDFLLDGSPPAFVGPDPCQGWEEMASRAESEDNFKEVPCIEIKETETYHKTDVDTSIPDFEQGGNTPMIHVVSHVALHNSTDALQEKTQDLHVDLLEKSNVSSEPEPHIFAAMSSSQTDKSDQETSSHPQFTELDNSQDALQQKNQYFHLELSVKSNGSSDPEPCISPSRSSQNRSSQPVLAAISPSQTDKVDQETSSHPHFTELDQKLVSPPQFNKLDQEPTSHPHFHEPELKTILPPQSVKASHFDEHELKAMFPPQSDESPHFDKQEVKTMLPPQSDDSLPHFDEQELKTMLPPQSEVSPHFDKQELKTTMLASQSGELEQVSDKGYSNSLVGFYGELSESKLHVIKRKSPQTYSLVEEMDASVEEESVVDSDTEETASILNYVTKMNGRAKTASLNNEFDDLMVCARTYEVNKHVNRVKGISFNGSWGGSMPSELERRQREIIELWDACNVPLAHRSYYFLLIKGQLSDSVYLNIEFWRLSFLKDTYSSATNITEKGLDVTPNSSLKALNRERKMLSGYVHKKFSRKEREELYKKWRIDLKTKHRSIQLAWLLWTNTKDLNHVRESAMLVAKLVGFIDSGEASKKLFGFGFLGKLKSRKSHDWEDSISTAI
ncbi:hypothetical protein TanjilG_12362 [Lupinus angustifolius]|uniref:Kinesin motor domain-containing protein n=1 Tax=Lupinus angustifolius TaxID=3871 RepID=A0A4P1QYD6_LUPAN|nr:PREDICTED: kinesin-like protein KIN-7F [Lupinus angustifolius]OIV97605.1 hypothetical protein TanjilG_12362 [Lupinus angustifolius]